MVLLTRLSCFRLNKRRDVVDSRGIKIFKTKTEFNKNICCILLPKEVHSIALINLHFFTLLLANFSSQKYKVLHRYSYLLEKRTKEIKGIIFSSSKVMNALEYGHL